MESEALVAPPLPSLRFRQPLSQLQLLCGVLWLGLAVRDGFRGRLSWVLWVTGAVVFLAGFFLAYWEFRPNGLFQRQLWSTRLVPYEDITSVHPAAGNAKVVDVEYGALVPGILPGTRLEIRLADRDAFLAELRRLAPAAEFLV